MAERFRPVPLSAEEERTLLVMREVIAEMRTETSPSSAQWYLALASEVALSALWQRNKGVGAVLSIHVAGTETILLSPNQVRSKRSSHLHAEEGVIDTFESVLRGDQTNLFQRTSSFRLPKVTLITTLEPCMGCVRRIISNGRINEVIIGSEDQEGGQMLGDRMLSIAPVFRKEAEELGLRIRVPNFDDPEDPYYIKPRYRFLVQDALGPKGVDFRLPKEANDWLWRRFTEPR